MHCVVAGPLRPAAGAVSLHWLPIPVTAAVGRDQAQVAGAVCRGSGIDANLRGRLAFAKEPYLHPRRVPLALVAEPVRVPVGSDIRLIEADRLREGHCGA